MPSEQESRVKNKTRLNFFQTGQRGVASDAPVAGSEHFRFRLPAEDGAQARPVSGARTVTEGAAEPDRIGVLFSETKSGRADGQVHPEGPPRQRRLQRRQVRGCHGYQGKNVRSDIKATSSQ